MPCAGPVRLIASFLGRRQQLKGKAEMHLKLLIKTAHCASAGEIELRPPWQRISEHSCLKSRAQREGRPKPAHSPFRYTRSSPLDQDVCCRKVDSRHAHRYPKHLIDNNQIQKYQNRYQWPPAICQALSGHERPVAAYHFISEKVL